MIKDYLTPEEVLMATKYNYMARVGDGDWFFFINKPKCEINEHGVHGWWVESGEFDDPLLGILNIKYEGDWKDSLICRDDLGFGSENGINGVSPEKLREYRDYLSKTIVFNEPLDLEAKKTTKIPFKWELIDSVDMNERGIFTERAKIKNGWFVRVIAFNPFDKSSPSISLISIFDPNYEWEIK